MEPFDSKAFGRRVFERRKELGWSQTRLGKEAGQSQTNIGWIEKGQPKDPEKQVIKLARALRLHQEWLLKGTGPRETAPVPLSAEEYAKLPLSLREELSELVRSRIAPKKQASR